MTYIRERKRTEQLNIRMTPEEKAAIHAAADKMNVTVTDLMVRATLDKIKEEVWGFEGTLRRLRQEGSI